MKLKSFLSLVVFAGCYMCSTNLGAQIYTEELIGFSYVRILNEKTQEREVLTFWAPGEGPSENGGITGIKSHGIWEPSLNDFIPFDENEMPETFELVEHESCGNCLTLVFSETKKEYYIQDHIYGDFWLQKATVNSKGEFTPTDFKYIREENSGGGEGEGTGEYVEEEESGQDAGLDFLTMYGVSAGTYNGNGVELFSAYEVSSVYIGDETEDSFEMERACDGDPETAWFSGETEESEDYPIGEYIILTGMVYNETIWILNGYQQSEDGFSENARIKTMDIYVSGQLVGEVILLDEMGAQQFVVPDIGRFMNGEAISIKLVITSVYPGTEYKDVGISEIYTVGG